MNELVSNCCPSSLIEYKFNLMVIQKRHSYSLSFWFRIFFIINMHLMFAVFKYYISIKSVKRGKVKYEGSCKQQRL